MKPKFKTVLTSVIIGVFLLLVDILSKSIVNRHLPFEKVQKTVFPFLNLYRTHNTGYHFIFGNINNHFLWALAGLVFVTILLVSLIHSLIKEDLDRANRFIYAAILSLTIGATGNILEILFIGYATDFFIFKPFPWPSNLCDQYINAILYIALPVIIIRSVIESVKRKRMSSSGKDIKEMKDQ